MRLWREEAILNTLWWSLWCQDKVEWEDWLWCIPFQRATLQVQEEEDSTAAAPPPPPALAQPLSSMRRPLLCTLKIEFSTFLFQFAFLLFLSLSCHHDHNTKREKSGYIFEKAGPKDLLCGGKNGLIYGCPKVLLLGTKIYQKRFFATLFSRYYRKQVQNEAKLLVFCCSFECRSKAWNFCWSIDLKSPGQQQSKS